MAIVKHTMIIECNDLSEYAEALSRLQLYSPTDSRFDIQTITEDELNLKITVVHEPTESEI